MREIIQIVAYDPGWVHAFEKERDKIRGAREYETLKRKLAATHSAEAFSTQQAYAHAKSAFIERIVEAALRAGYPRCL